MAFRKQQDDEGDGFDEGSGTSDSDSSEHVSESLSDIDDAEISPYLLTKKEALYKTIIWEAMNRDYVEKRSTIKRARKGKEAGPRRKAAKTCTKSTDKAKKSNGGQSNLASGVEKRRSSKINYDAINEDDCGFGEGLESNEKVNRAEHSEEAEDDNYEAEHENQYNEDDEFRYEDEDYNRHNDGWF